MARILVRLAGLCRAEFQQFMGSRYLTVGTEDHLVDTRIQEMDEEGADIQSWSRTPSAPITGA
jgi:hypothetical protein